MLVEIVRQTRTTMRWKLTSNLIAVATLVVACTAHRPPDAAGPQDAPTLWYRQPAGNDKNLEESLPLGNGQLGVMMRNTHGLDYLFNHGNFFASSDMLSRAS